MKIIDKLKNKMEYLFGLAGLIISIIFLIAAIIYDGNYNPLYRAVSSLAEQGGKTLFSIGFIIAGSLAIPFYIKLEKSLVLKGRRDNIRRIATAISIVSCVAIGLIGVIPDENFPVEFAAFHITMAITSFVGTSIYIGVFSLTMLLNPKYNLFIPILGFLAITFLGLLAIFRYAIIEWILTILIFIWIFSTIVHSLRS